MIRCDEPIGPPVEYDDSIFSETGTGPFCENCLSAEPMSEKYLKQMADFDQTGDTGRMAREILNLRKLWDDYKLQE